MKNKVSVALWSVAIVFLIAVMIFVNFFNAKPSKEGSPTDGQLQDFSIKCLDGTEFSLSGQRGKVVVINLWATWCIPCIDELPNFDRINSEYPDKVSVIAIHTTPVTTDVAGWLSDYDYGMRFAVDGEGDLSEILNPSSVLPQTIVIDGEGNVVYNKTGSLSYEELSDIIVGAIEK